MRAVSDVLYATRRRMPSRQTGLPPERSAWPKAVTICKTLEIEVGAKTATHHPDDPHDQPS